MASKAGADTILTALRAATGIEPEILGKPQPHMICTALARLYVAGPGVVMLSDRVDTDVAVGQAAGLFSILVGPGMPGSGYAEVRPDAAMASLTGACSATGSVTKNRCGGDGVIQALRLAQPASLQA